MKKSDIKKLASGSYKNGILDEQIVLKIAKHLKKSDLRTYIQELKLIEAQNTVNVSTSTKLSKDLENDLKQIFKGKKIEFTEDKNLIAGIKIVDFDKIYELNLKNTFSNMIEFINK
jgi:F0F1-type ATP synthase delta subunit